MKKLILVVKLSLTSMSISGCFFQPFHSKIVSESQTSHDSTGTNSPTFPNNGSDQEIYNLYQSGKVLYETNCASCHKPINISAKRNKSLDEIKIGIQFVASMKPLSVLSESQLFSIEYALNNVEPNAPSSENSQSPNASETPPYQTGGDLSSDRPFACSDPQQSLQFSPTKRLSKQQIKNTVLDLAEGYLNEDSLKFELALIPADSYKFGFNSIDDNVTLEHVEAYRLLALKVSELLFSNVNWKNKVTSNSCSNSSIFNESSDCFNLLVSNYYQYIFRKTLSQDELNDLKNIFSEFSSMGSWAAAQKISEILLQSPQFLFHLEVNGGDYTDDSIALDTFELANKLSYLAWNTMPDRELFDLAKSGEISNQNTFKQQVNRLFLSDKAQMTFKDFYTQWLEFQKLPSMTYSNTFLNGINKEGLKEKVLEDSLSFLFNLTKEKGTYKDIFLSKQVTINSTELAAIYELPHSTVGQLSVTLQGEQRAGILTRAAFLSSGVDKATPIHRGVVIRRNVLCDDIPNPNPDDFEDPSVLAPPEVSTFESLRQQIEKRTSPNQCQVCHSLINPPAFALEAFDSLGRNRNFELVIENNQVTARHPVDFKVTDPKIEAANEPTISGALELSQRIANGNKGPACFTQKWYAYSLNRSPALANPCDLEHMYKSLTDIEFDAKLSSDPATLMNFFKSTTTTYGFSKRKWRK